MSIPVLAKHRNPLQMAAYGDMAKSSVYVKAWCSGTRYWHLFTSQSYWKILWLFVLALSTDPDCYYSFDRFKFL